MIFLFKRQFVMDFPPSHVWWQQRVPSFTGAIFMRGRQKGRATLRSPTSCIPNWSPGALSVRGSFGWRKSTLLEQKLLWKSPWNCWNFRISLNQDLANGMGYPVWSGGAGPLSGVENVPTLRESCDARLLFGSICWRNIWMQPRK